MATVHVLRIEHPHGETLGVHPSRAAAVADAFRYVEEWWTKELPDMQMPRDEAAAVDLYFEIMSERGKEFYYINEAEFAHPPLAVVLEGGLVQGIVSTEPSAFGRVFVIDYDDEGAEPAELTAIPQRNGEEADGYFREETVDHATIDLTQAIGRFDKGETVETGKLGRLEEDSEGDEKAARAAGWKLDFDLFWTRAKRAGDLSLPEARADLGCDSKNEVWLRRASYALAYDRGEIPERV